MLANFFPQSNAYAGASVLGVAETCFEKAWVNSLIVKNSNQTDLITRQTHISKRASNAASFSNSERIHNVNSNSGGGFGFLTGKYRNNKLPENSRQKLFGEYYTRYTKPNASIVIEEYFNIAKKFALDFTQMSIKFCEIQKFLTSVIIGATSMEQLKIDIESVNVNLTEEILKEINNVQIKHPNPCP